MKSARATIWPTGAVLVTLLGAAVVAAPAAIAAAPARGHFSSAAQHRNGSIRVRGVVHAPSSTTICVAVRSVCVRTVHASGERFSALLSPQRPGVRLTLRTRSGQHRRLDSISVRTPGQRVIAVAKKHVGDRYTYGGSSPHVGFDCSGYTRYSYKKAGIAHLPHNTDAQMRAPHMHRIARDRARPGDLIFYMSGGSSYHVAIFAGHGMQYAAADPHDGVRYQHIWSRHIQFRTNWH